MCPDALTKSKQGEHDSIGVMAKEYAYAGRMSESFSTNGHTNGHGVHRQQILNRHLAGCVTTAIRSHDENERERVIGELMAVFKTNNKI